MATITAGNSLYIYRLLKDEIGLNRQTLISRFDEVFAADGIDPADMDCADTRDVLQNLGDFIEIITFKKGNTYAIVRPYPKWDEVLGRLDAEVPGKNSPRQKTNGKNGKSRQGANRNPWKTGQTKDPRPTKPGAKKKRQKQASEPVLETKANLEIESESSNEDVPVGAVGADVSITNSLVEDEILPSPNSDELEVEDIQKPRALTVQEILEIARAEEALEAQRSKEQAVEVEAAHSGALTTHDEVKNGSSITSSDDVAPKTEMAASGQVSEPDEHHLAPLPQRETADSFDRLKGYPEYFEREVFVKGGPLLILNQILPLGIDIIDILEQDWRASRGAGTFEGSRSIVTYPLRYLHQDGSPITVTMQKMPARSHGKRWAVTKIDGDDGSAGIHEPAEIDGASLSSVGAWRNLLPMVRRHEAADASMIRELSQFAILGSWDAFIDSLAEQTMPEQWSISLADTNKDILSEYIADTFHRIIKQDRLYVSDDGSIAAFDTGLRSPSYDDLFACFVPHQGDIAWQFAGFTTATAGISGVIDDLGQALLDRLDKLPQPATYIGSLADVSLLDNASIELADEIASRLGDQTRVAFDRAVRSVRANYRLATPAYEPFEDKTVLLLPLSLDDDGNADCAMVVELQDNNKGDTCYRGISLAPLDAAYACARVITCELPSWLVKGINR